MRGVVALLGLGVCLTLGTSNAQAAPMTAFGGDDNHVGNGKHNHNALSIRSPTRNSGFQPISNANASGVTNSRNALCKKVHFCKIRQNGVIYFH